MLTKEQVEKRRGCLGSSDMAAILGLDPFKTAGDVFLEKTGKLKPMESTAVMRRGHYIEKAVLAYASDELGELEVAPYHAAPDLHLGANVDATVLENGLPIEAKSVGAYAKEVWGEQGTDDVPGRVLIQAHVHLICTEKDYCHIPVYLPYREFQMFGVKRDGELMRIIIDAAIMFWEDNVVKDIPPDETPMLETIKRIKREPKTVVDIPQGLVDIWQFAKGELKAAEQAENIKKAELLAAIGTAEAGKYDDGLVTFYEQKRSGIDVKRLRAEEPEIAKQYMKESFYRVMRIKKTKLLKSGE